MKRFEALARVWRGISGVLRTVRGGRWGQIFSAASVLLALHVLMQTALYRTARERTFDYVQSRSTPTALSPLFVDIDREALQTHGAWPWSRERLAGLMTKIAAADPQVVAIDLVLEGEDTRSPAALARAIMARETVPQLAGVTLPDGDLLLANAIARKPTILGLALDPLPREKPVGVRPVLMQGVPDVARVWTEAGLVGAPDVVASRAAGAGVSVMPGDHDGSVRRVPLFAVADDTVVPGLAADVMRVVVGGPPLMRLLAQPPTLVIGAQRIAFDSEAMIRVAPPRATDIAAITVSANDVIKGETVAVGRLKGRIVIVGSSAPEAGGLRPNGAGEPTPASAFHVAALRQLASGVLVRRPMLVERGETIALMAAGALGGVGGALLAPWLAIGVALATAIVATIGVISLFATSKLLIDPLIVPLALAAGGLATILVSAARTRRLQAQMRQRFEQHLAPAVIAQLIAEPSALRIEGRERVITALFTDVEGFTSMTERAAARDLISALDTYFDGMCRIVVSHGGMVDKIVGDAVHAIFNAPLDLDDHPRKAIDCALALAEFAATYREEALPKALGFGRTRIGIETGQAIVGDVGGDRKLDYTAHGHAVNAAARLEAANKEFGTTIAIGPGTAAAVGVETLRKVGSIELRGQSGTQDIYTVG